MAIYLADPAGAALIRKLAAKADVLIGNFKVGGLAKYKLGHEDLRHLAPRLVYCSITGFGQTGPHAPRADYDVLAHGYGGS